MEDARQHFDGFVEGLQSCAALLADVRQSYSKVLQCVESGQLLTAATAYRAEALSAESVSTCVNYSRRLQEIHDRIATIKEENSKITDEISAMRSKRYATSKEKELAFARKGQQLLQLMYNKRQTLNLSAGSKIDPAQLKSQHLKVKGLIKEAQHVTESRYVSSASNESLRQQLVISLGEKESYMAETNKLDTKLMILKKVVSSMNSNAATEMEVMQSVMATVECICDGKSDTTNIYPYGDPEDPEHEQETEVILNSNEKFNYLFESSLLEAAALQATASPKGVLRTVDTLARFKKLPKSAPGLKLPLLTYCEALMQSSPAYNAISLQETIECVMCASQEGQLKTLAYWISKEWFPHSLEVASVILQDCTCHGWCTCGRQNMAHTIFVRCGALKEASLCLLYQGRSNGFLQFTNAHKFSKQDYRALLHSVPSVELGKCLIMPPAPYQPPLAAVEVLLSLLNMKCFHIALTLLQEYTRSSTHVTIHDMSVRRQQWEYLVLCLQEIGEDVTAFEVLAAITVSTAMTLAMNELQCAPTVNEHLPLSHTPCSENESVRKRKISSTSLLSESSSDDSSFSGSSKF